jgi:polyribonucleotide nucleotidyltransferase
MRQVITRTLRRRVRRQVFVVVDRVRQEGRSAREARRWSQGSQSEPNTHGSRCWAQISRVIAQHLGY